MAPRLAYATLLPLSSSVSCFATSTALFAQVKASFNSPFCANAKPARPYASNFSTRRASGENPCAIFAASLHKSAANEGLDFANNASPHFCIAGKYNSATFWSDAFPAFLYKSANGSCAQPEPQKIIEAKVSDKTMNDRMISPEFCPNHIGLARDRSGKLATLKPCPTV